MEGEPKFDDLEKRLAAGPVISVPTITLEGDAVARFANTGAYSSWCKELSVPYGSFMTMAQPSQGNAAG